MLFQKLTEVAATAPSTSGIRQNGVLHPYAGLIERIERLAGGFQSVGFSQGDVVALMMPNSVDLFVVSHALFAIGAIAVPLNPAANPRELQWAGNATGVSGIVARPESMAAAARLKEDLGKEVPVIATGDDGPMSVGALEQHRPASLHPIDPDLNAVYLFSSGSTGRSKIVPHTQPGMIASALHSTSAFGIAPDDIVLNGLPSHHAFGYMTAVAAESLTGGTTAFWSDPQPIMLSRARMLKAIEENRVTVLPGVPFLYDLLATVPDNVDVSSVRIAYSGGVAMKRPTFDRFHERFGIPIRQVFGMSEAALVTANTDDDPFGTWDSVGRAVPPVTLEIVPSADAPTPDVGELFIKTPGMIKGYLTDDPKPNAVFKNGGMLTGDLGRIADNGHLYITGRSKLIIEVSGVKVDPIEVEDVLMSHPAVGEAVVVGIPDPRTGEQRIKAVVVKKSEETADNILRFSRGKLTPHKVPVVLEFRDELPRSSTGKVLRGQLID